MALQQQGKTAEACAYQESLRLQPDQPDALNDLAWNSRATHPDPRFRDGARAVAGAQRAVELSRSEVHTVDTLAAAYAEAGRFPGSPGHGASKALELARQQNNPALADALRTRIALYESRESPCGRPRRLPRSRRQHLDSLELDGRRFTTS